MPLPLASSCDEVHTPHASSHLAAMLVFLHLFSFLLHHLEPFLSTQPLEGGGGGGVAPMQSQLLQSHSYSSSRYEHV